jgi:hypothetical protein
MLAKKSTMMGLFLLAASFFTGCDSDDEAPSTEGFSGRYHVVITEAGIVNERTWEINQRGFTASIKDLNTLLLVQATVSGQTLFVPPSTLTLGGETVVFSMTLTFSSDGRSFAGTQTTLVDGSTINVAVSGTKV